MSPGVEAYPTPLGRRRCGLLARAASTAGGWLLEPPQPEAGGSQPEPAGPRPVVAVFGLRRGCGTTVVARALAAELATRDAGGAAAVACEAATTAGIPLATRAASQLARALAIAPGVATRAVGRLCLVESPDQLALADTSRLLAPVVLDAGSSSLGGAPASLADRTVLVATPSIEPALTQVAAHCLLRVGVEPVVVVNRTRAAGARDGPDDAERRGSAAGTTRAPLELPEARMGAQLALGGREARGELGRAVAELADLCGGDA